MVLVRMGDDDADKVLLDLFDKSDVGKDEIDAGQFVAGEGDADIDQQPFAPFGWAEAVEGAVHADLAEAAKRREDQFVLVSHTLDAFRVILLVAGRLAMPRGRCERGEAIQMS